MNFSVRMYPSSLHEKHGLLPFDRKLVVSAFNENLGWIDKFFPGIQRVIYQKGVADGNPILPNIGFEAHTWFYYFYEHYYDLEKLTVCLQGNPFDHFGNEFWSISNKIHTANPDDFTFLPLAGLSNGSFQNRDGSPNHYRLPELEKMWRELFGVPPPELFYSFFSGQFMVHRDIVRKRPREFYRKGMELVKTKEDACAIERMWHYIFSGI